MITTIVRPFFQLGQGVLVIVSPSLIKRCKNHFHNLPCGVTVILGNNGYVWICPLQSTENAEGGFIQKLDVSSFLFQYGTYTKTCTHERLFSDLKAGDKK